MGYTDDYTELELKKLEKRIASEYRKAYASISAQADSYFEQFIDRYEKEYDAYMKGQYTKEEFDAWYRTQVARGEGWVQFKEDIASRITNANEIAASYINGTTPNVFKENKNYTSYEISQLHAGTSFRVYNEEAIKELMTNKNHTEFRTVAINPIRDYEWNQKQIQSALLSGIIQGKPAKQIADSFMPVMKRNKAAAIRNARTAVTSACNGGRINALHEAQHKGIDVRKKWLCMRDRRVRNSHVNLDGQIRDIDDPFDNDLMYPADPDGIGAEVYNCRCRLTYVYPKYEDEQSRENFSESKYDGETYQEWLKRMEKEENLKMAKKGEALLDVDAVKHTKKEFTEIRKFSEKAGVRIGNIAEFDGDISLLQEQITTLSKMKKIYNIDDVVINVSNKLDNTTLAQTTKNVITFNNLTLRNRELTEAFLNSTSDLAPTTMAGIGAHEFGHTIVWKYGNKWLELSKKAYYNVFEDDVDTSNLISYMRKNISFYCVDIKDKYKEMPFNQRYYKEVIPEIIGLNETTPTKYTTEFVKLLQEEIS